MKKMFKLFSLSTALSFGLALTASGQLQWNSYDTSGNLVTANVASGGDITSGGTVTFTIPANTQLSFVTKNFIPINLATGNSRNIVTFKVSVSAGFGGVAQRTMGWGLYNSAGTAGFTDDVGYFGLWNGGGPYIECYDHPAGTANLLSGSAQGQGTVNTGTPSDATTYTNQIQLVMNSAATGIALGSSSSTLAAAGLAMNGVNVTHRVYTNPVNGPLGGVTSFDEFAFMFNNTTANPVTVTLSGVSLGSTMTWDASGASPAAPTDGTGNWSFTNLNWSTGLADNGWLPGYNAVLGSGGAGGTVTLTAATTVVGNITLNTNYVIAGNPLTLTNGSVITVAGTNTSASISAILTGTGGFTKEGPGVLVLNGSVNNTYTGDTIINNGTLQPGGTASRLYVAGNLIVNPNGTFVANSGNPGQGVFGGATAVINGGAVSNISSGTFGAGLAVLANNGRIFNANGTLSATYYVTNTDARSGSVYLTRHGFGITNFLYKSTAGSVVIGTRPNSSSADGFVVTLNAGALFFDKAYANQASGRLKQGTTLTFAGGMLVFSNTLTTLSPSSENGSGNTVFNPGASSFFSTNAGGGGNVTFGTLTRNPGATFNFVPQVGTGLIGSTVTPVNGIVGGWNTYNLTDWTAGTTAWTNLAPSGYTLSADPTTWVAGNNVSLSASSSPDVPTSTTINTLRLTAASTVNLAGTLTLSSGGLLVTGSGATAITSGTLLGASGADLIVHQNASADLTISSTLADNGAATALTKDGTGKLIITGTDSMTGTNYLNGGVVEVSDLAKLASGGLDMNGGTLHYTGSDTTSSRGVRTRGLGPTFDIVGGTKFTQSGAINGSGDAIGDLGGITKNGSGTLILTTSNNFNGETLVNNGVLSINGTNNCNSAVWDAGKVTVSGGTLGGSGVISGAVTVKAGGTISPGNSPGTLTLATNLTLQNGSTSLFDVTNSPGVGDLLVVQGNLTVSNSTIAINVLGTSLQPGTNTLIQYSGKLNGTFNPVVTLVGGTINGSTTIDTSTPGLVNLVLIPQVVIIGQPQDTIASTNDPVTFTVTATGSASIGYQWYFYGTNVNNAPTLLAGANSSSYFIASAQGTNNGFYAVVVTNFSNSVTSRYALLTVGNVPPQINGPYDQTVIQGNSVTFRATNVLANPPPTYQWQTNSVDVSGATSTNLTLNNVQFALDGTQVSIIASNAAAMVTNTATLHVIVPPVISPQPTNITVHVGDPVNIVAGISSGVPTPGVQWYKNNLGLPGQTSLTLTIASAQGSDIGTYTLVATNAAGTATSFAARLTVLSTNLVQTTLSPANNAAAVCYDTPLYLNFNDTVSVVNSGKVRIFNATNTVTPVDTIDMSSNTVVVATLTTGVFLTNNIQVHSPFSGDSSVFNYFPVITTGSTAAIYPHAGVMTSNQTYYVTLDNGIIKDSAGAYFVGISDTNAWRFTTKPTGPTNLLSVVVAADGSGDFATVQGAIDGLPTNGPVRRVININNGTYMEIVDVTKTNITFRGQNRTNTIVGYGNNNNLNGSTANRMAFKVNASDIAIENMTVVNTTPQGGSQSEAIMVNTAAARFIFNNAEVTSLQDTILANVNSSQGYFYNSTVRGNFDYIWGGGNLFITNCLIYTIPNIYVTNNYNLTASRTDFGVSNATDRWLNPSGSYTADGIDYIGCKLQADPAVHTVTLEGANGTANGLVAFITCLVDTNHYVSPTAAITNTYLFWEYNNSNIDGTFPVGLGGVTLTNGDPRLIAAQSATNWLYGWNPALLPNIIGQPGNQSASAGQPASFTVSATGIPDPTYQWQHAGTNVPSGTGATLTIASAQRSDGGSYAVIVSNGSGSVTSSVVTLTYNNTAPVANPSTYSRPAGYPLNIPIAGNLATYWSDVDGDLLALTGPISSTNAAAVSYDSTYVHYTNMNDVADLINYTIGDGFGGTAAGQINVLVGPPPTNSITGTVVNGNGTVTLSFLGAPNYIYQVESTTNLAPAVWIPVSTNTADINGLWQFTDQQATNYPQQFYRSVYRP